MSKTKKRLHTQAKTKKRKSRKHTKVGGSSDTCADAAAASAASVDAASAIRKAPDSVRTALPPSKPPPTPAVRVPTRLDQLAEAALIHRSESSEDEPSDDLSESSDDQSQRSLAKIRATVDRYKSRTFADMTKKIPSKRKPGRISKASVQNPVSRPSQAATSPDDGATSRSESTKRPAVTAASVSDSATCDLEVENEGRSKRTCRIPKEEQQIRRAKFISGLVVGSDVLYKETQVRQIPAKIIEINNLEKGNKTYNIQITENKQKKKIFNVFIDYIHPPHHHG